MGSFAFAVRVAIDRFFSGFGTLGDYTK